MTPQLQQAIKLLQLSNLELGAYVETELERNALLEREDESAGRDEREAGPTDSEAWSATPSDDVVGAHDAPLDTDLSSTWGDDIGSDALPAGGGDDALYAGWGHGSGRGGSFDDDFSPDQTLASEPTLREHLIEQLMIDVPDPVMRAIGAHLIDNLDESGWLTVPLESVAERLGCGLDQVEATVAAMQRFDPPGIFARSLSECLAMKRKRRASGGRQAGPTATRSGPRPQPS